MTVARIYYMHAREGMAAELETGLRDLVEMVVKIDGSRGAEVLRDMGNERRFMFIERWDDVEAHKAGAAAFAKLDMGSVMEALDGPPDGGYFDSLAAK